MGNFPENISLRDIKKLAADNVTLGNMFARLFASSYDEFVTVLYEDLDSVVQKLEGNPQLYREDSEDELTGHIVAMLNSIGYDISHGTTGGGSKDITVNGKHPSWSWIGEAKIYKSITNLHEGYAQLSTRYRNADPTKACAGLLAYVTRDKAANLMDKWKLEFTQLPLPNLSSFQCPSRGRLAFFSVHDHQASGLPFQVRHLAVCLYFQPEDRSGREAKRYNSSKDLTR